MKTIVYHKFRPCWSLTLQAGWKWPHWLQLQLVAKKNFKGFGLPKRCCFGISGRRHRKRLGIGIWLHVLCTACKMFAGQHNETIQNHRIRPQSTPRYTQGTFLFLSWSHFICCFSCSILVLVNHIILGGWSRRCCRRGVAWLAWDHKAISIS